ncbi:MAG: dihydrolipoamide acetyltransferase family protein [Planctomycetota bacterium]
MAGKTSTDPNIFILPDLGEGVHEAELISWKVEPGQTVNEHDILAEMETDKALVEVPSPRDGTIKTLHGEPGEICHVGNPLVTYESGNNNDAPAPAPEPSAAKAADTTEDAGTVVGAMSDVMPGMGGGDGKALATPAVRRLARDLGVDINSVQGSGIGGRVTKKDVEAFAKGGGAAKAAPAPAASPPPTPAETRRPLPPQGPGVQPSAIPQQPAYQPMPQQQFMPQQQMPMQPMAPGYGMPMMTMMPTPFGFMPVMMPPQGMGAAGGIPQAPGFTPFGVRPIPMPNQTPAVQPGQPEARVPFRGVRRTIAQRLRDSVNTAVHFTVVDEADVAELDAYRKDLSAQTGTKLSFLPFVAAAVCRALTNGFGALNATVDEANSEIVEHGSVHLGIAADTDSGLMVPVIPNANAMSVPQLGAEIVNVATAARDRTIARDRLIGSTFTISNVGSHAGKFATPVINAPEVAILAVGKAYDGVAVRDGQAVVTKILPLSLACDHRVVDGATAALCLAKVVELLKDQQQLV